MLGGDPWETGIFVGSPGNWK